MAISSGFFNSVSGDRKYNAEQMSMYFDKLITSGVFPNPSTNLQVLATTGMTINVLPGRGMINCRWVNNDANFALTVDGSDAVLNRIDSVIMKLDLSDSVRYLTIEIKKGTLATSPVAPTMERSTYIQEYCLANIYVAALADEITQADITDMRASASCGWVTSLIEQVDTSELFVQWQDAYKRYYEESTAAFLEWFNGVKETLSTAAVIKNVTNTYVTTTQDESEITIGIDGYNSDVDVLTVYINGLKLIQGVDYTIGLYGTTIVLTKSVDLGTVIEFEVFKSTDGEDAWSAIDIAEASQPKIYKDVTVATSDWTQGETYYEATIANDTIDEDTFVQVNFTVTSLSVATDAGVLGIAETVEGGIKLYSETIPESDLTCDYVIQKGKVIA